MGYISLCCVGVVFGCMLLLVTIVGICERMFVYLQYHKIITIIGFN